MFGKHADIAHVTAKVSLVLHLVMLWDAHISVHEQLLMIVVLLHSSIHELESIQQTRQLANGV